MTSALCHMNAIRVWFVEIQQNGTAANRAGELSNCRFERRPTSPPPWIEYQMWTTMQECLYQWCDLRPSVLGQDRYEIKKSVSVLILVIQVWCCETWFYCARRHNDLEGSLFVLHTFSGTIKWMWMNEWKMNEGYSNFLSTIYSFSIVCLEHHYCGDQKWRSLT